MLPDVCLLTCTLDLYIVMPTLWSNKPVLSNREKLIRKYASKWIEHKEFLEGIQSAAHGHTTIFILLKNILVNTNL